eukprot:CAMPEP_0177678630 /NCGR_PEP_ID=MMETSP0447-20121125/29112_1 /TAXON_ID=0 /ORGANISM="Stygamoeba regulata, Strain BSH-02190019" /LENGTH=166 /DNA_ID=CAMNT_0019187647 /DNA_START=1257 /DNA_END=1758 /DNA_ORIENTATION=+
MPHAALGGHNVRALNRDARLAAFGAAALAWAGLGGVWPALVVVSGLFSADDTLPERGGEIGGEAGLEVSGLLLVVGLVVFSGLFSAGDADTLGDVGGKVGVEVVCTARPLWSRLTGRVGRRLALLEAAAAGLALWATKWVAFGVVQLSFPHTACCSVRLSERAAPA